MNNMRLCFPFFLLCALNAAAQKSLPGNTILPGLNTDSLRKEMTRIRISNRARAAKIQFQYFIIKAPGNTYGYNVYADGNLYLHQTGIPGMSGNRGFTDTASAGTVARFAIKKIKQGEIPPTITEKELRKLKVKRSLRKKGRLD